MSVETALTALETSQPYENLINRFFGTGFVGYYLSQGIVGETLYAVIFIACLLTIALVAYLLGSINFAILISAKQYRQDIRQHGSKNAGMTNMMRTYGKKAAGLTLLGDALKAVVACLIGYAILGHLGAYLAGLFCVLGHVFPVFYRFKGGKGVVTAAVSVLMCHPLAFLILLVIFLIIVLSTRYISLGSIMCVLIYPVILTSFPSGRPYGIYAVLITVVVVFKHWENIKRLRAGTESKFSFKKSIKAPAESSDTEVPATESNTEQPTEKLPHKKETKNKSRNYGKKKK